MWSTGSWVCVSSSSAIIDCPLPFFAVFSAFCACALSPISTVVHTGDALRGYLGLRQQAAVFIAFSGPSHCSLRAPSRHLLLGHCPALDHRVHGRHRGCGQAADRLWVQEGPVRDSGYGVCSYEAWRLVIGTTKNGKRATYGSVEWAAECSFCLLFRPCDLPASSGGRGKETKAWVSLVIALCVLRRSVLARLPGSPTSWRTRSWCVFVRFVCRTPVRKQEGGLCACALPCVGVLDLCSHSRLPAERKGEDKGPLSLSCVHACPCFSSVNTKRTHPGTFHPVEGERAAVVRSGGAGGRGTQRESRRLGLLRVRCEYVVLWVLCIWGTALALYREYRFFARSTPEVGPCQCAGQSMGCHCTGGVGCGRCGK